MIPCTICPIQQMKWLLVRSFTSMHYFSPNHTFHAEWVVYFLLYDSPYTVFTMSMSFAFYFTIHHILFVLLVWVVYYSPYNCCHAHWVICFLLYYSPCHCLHVDWVVCFLIYYSPCQCLHGDWVMCFLIYYSP